MKLDSLSGTGQLIQMYKPVKKVALTVLAASVLGSGLAGAIGCTKSTPIPNPKPEPTPVPTSAYELALEKLDSKIAEYWKGVPLNPNSEQAINELVFIPEEGRLVLAKDIEAYIENKKIEGGELSDLIDPDRDGIKSSEDSNPMDPSNSTQEISPKTFSFVRNLVKYNNSQGNLKTLPEIYPGLDKLIEVVESNSELTRDFSSQQNHILANLISGIPGIANYPKAMRQGTIQVVNQDLTDEYSLKEFVIPAIACKVQLQEKGKINALNGLGIPDEALEEEGIRQILLPIELREINLTTGVFTLANIETGVYNVSVDKSLGKSPLEWLHEIAARDFNDKNSNGYKFVYRENAIGTYGPITPWKNSANKFVEGVDMLLQNGDDLTFFLIRYPTYLRAPSNLNLGNDLVPELTEQRGPYYSVVLGGLFGEALFDVVANYPGRTNPARPQSHSEAFRLMSNTSDSWLLPYRFGFWPDRQAFIDDYKDRLLTPSVGLRHADGNYEQIIFEQSLSQQKK